MKYKYKVISLHTHTECDMQPRCPFCYRSKESINTKPQQFFLDLIPYISKLTPQVALGGGEPLCKPEFIKLMSKECKKNNLILNITTNGYALQKMNDKQLKEVLEGITMVSISYDKHKRPDMKAFGEYHKLVNRIHKLTKTQVGCNLLIDETMFKDNGKPFLTLVTMMFKIINVDRVFALSPKNILCPDILKHKNLYMGLSKLYPHFYVDDLTKEVLEQGYKDWKTSCHYSKDLISINEKGEIMGCSFDSKPLMVLDKPEDLLKTKDIKSEERFNCPYLKR